MGKVIGPVRDIVTEPKYLDASMPGKTAFTHPVPVGHTALAYVIEGQAYFDEGRDAYGHEAVGANYFDLERPCLMGPESLVLFERSGDSIVVTTENDPVWFCPDVRQAHRRARGMVRTHRHEHTGGAAIALDEFRQGTFIKHGEPPRRGAKGA